MHNVQSMFENGETLPN